MQSLARLAAVAHGVAEVEVRRLLASSDGASERAWSVHGGDALHRMVEFNEDCGALQALLECANLDVNCRRKDGLTALHVAARDGREAVVRALMSREDMDLNATAANSMTPLHVAARLGHVRVVKELVRDECRLILQAKTVHGFTALHLVAEGGGGSEVVALLRAPQEQAGFVNLRDVAGRTALHYAARNGDSETARELLAFPSVEVNAVDGYGFTPLHLAVQKGHVNVTCLLMMRADGVDLNCRSGVRTIGSQDAIPDGALPYPVLSDEETGPLDVTPVHIAASGSHYKILSSLLSSTRVNRRAVDCQGSTALHFAAAFGDVTVVKLLMDEQELDLCCCDFAGRTPLVLAATHSRLEVLQALLGDATALAVTPDHSLHLAMQLLAVAKRPEVADYIINCLESSAQPGCSTLMHWAAKNGNTALMELVLAWKPEAVNATDGKKKQTPLHLAAIHGHTELVQSLCSGERWPLRAAEVDKNGALALDYAFEQGKRAREIRMVLLQRPDVKEYMERIYRLEMNTMNALFVGATLFASVTYVGWMQPPLGFTEHYRYPLKSPPTPEGTYAVFAETGNVHVRLFFIFNTLSFILSLTTIFRGIEAVAYRRKELEAGYMPRILRANIRHCYVYFYLSTTFIIAAFEQAAYAVLAPDAVTWYIPLILYTLWGSWGLLCIVMARKHLKKKLKAWKLKLFNRRKSQAIELI